MKTDYAFLFEQAVLSAAPGASETYAVQAALDWMDFSGAKKVFITSEKFVITIERKKNAAPEKS